MVALGAEVVPNRVMQVNNTADTVGDEVPEPPLDHRLRLLRRRHPVAGRFHRDEHVGDRPARLNVREVDALIFSGLRPEVVLKYAVPVGRTMERSSVR